MSAEQERGRDEARRDRALDLGERLVAAFEVYARATRRLSRSCDKLAKSVTKKVSRPTFLYPKPPRGGKIAPR